MAYSGGPGNRSTTTAFFITNCSKERHPLLSQTLPVALTPGTRLGVDEATALIGAGGMGEVYRATDSNLTRSVAIKLL